MLDLGFGSFFFQDFDYMSFYCLFFHRFIQKSAVNPVGVSLYMTYFSLPAFKIFSMEQFNISTPVLCLGLFVIILFEVH
jgi:hypothetical protein